MSENVVHPSAIVGARVQMGTGNYVGPGAVLAGDLVLGDDNWIGAYVVLGALPEVRGFPHTSDWLDEDEGAGTRVGSRNVFREGAQLHRGWQGATVMGDDAFIMNQVYLAHDCQIGDFVTMASTVAVGGHCVIGDRTNLGLGAVVHQRTAIGTGAMVGMGAVVTRDVLAFTKTYGNPARPHGINTIGMQRAGIAEAVIERTVVAFEAGTLADFLAAHLADDAGLVGSAT
jgi:UDP-N-acetylglucosamine acyltransferase